MIPEQQKTKVNPPPERVASSKRTLLIAALLVFMIIIVSVVYFSFVSDDRILLSAEVNRIEGSVMVQLAGKAETIPAEEGMELNEGDRIITGADGTMQISYEDGSITRVAPDSRVDIRSLYIDADGADITVLNVDGGGLWNAVVSLVDRNSRFEVNTPSSVAGVRGTNYYVRVDDQDETLVRCYEGEVGLSQTSDDLSETSFQWFTGRAFAYGVETLLGPFQQTRSRPGVPPPPDPDPIDPLDVDDFEKDNLVEDQPEAYVEVGYQASSILAEQTEARINETSEEMDILQKELDLLEELLVDETDPERTEQLNNLIEQILAEIEHNSHIMQLLEDDYKDLLKERDMFEELRQLFEDEEPDPDEIREKARTVRDKERENQTQRQSRQEQADQEKQRAVETRENITSAARDLGIEEEMSSIRDETPPADSDDDSDDDPDDDPGEDPSDEPVSYTVTLAPNPSEGGTVSGGGNYEEGLSVMVTASPVAGYRFANWTLGGNVVSTSRSYSFTVVNNLNLVANFRPLSYTISAEAEPSEGGTVTGGGRYEYNEQVTLEASAEEGYRFAGWFEEGEQVSEEATYTFSITGDRNLEAEFELTEHEISLSAEPSEGGTVAGGGRYEYNEQVTVEASAEEGYRFAGWLENGEQVSEDADYTFSITGDRNLEAKFELTEYEISLSAEPSEGGTVTGGDVYQHGTTVTVNAVPADNYEFVNWTEDGEEVSGEKEYSFTADSDRNLTAQYVFAAEYTINLEVDPGDAGMVSGRGVYELDSTATVEVLQVSTGYSFEGWYEDDELVSEDMVYSFEVTEDRNLVASFEWKQYNVFLSVSPQGAGELTGAGLYNFGATAIVVTEANPGYEFNGWHEDDTLVHPDSSYSFEVKRDRTLTAVYTYKDIPPEYDPPLAINFVPEDKAVGVVTDTEISVTFDIDVKEAVPGALQNITIIVADDHTPVADINVSLVERTITITHPGLDYDTEYTVTVPELTVINEEEDPNEEVVWTFTTEPEPDPDPDPEPKHEISDITARYSKVSEAIYAGYIIFYISGNPESVEVIVNGEHPFTFAGTEDGRYIFEGITEEKPETVEIIADDETYTLDVTWEDTTGDKQE